MVLVDFSVVWVSQIRHTATMLKHICMLWPSHIVGHKSTLGTVLIRNRAKRDLPQQNPKRFLTLLVCSSLAAVPGLPHLIRPAGIGVKTYAAVADSEDTQGETIFAR